MATKDDIESDLTLEIDGEEISFQKFIDAINAFHTIINELSEESLTLNSDPTDWSVSVRHGSNLISAFPPSSFKKNISDKVIEKMRAIIDNLENGRLENIDISEKITNEIKKLTKVASLAKYKVNLWLKKTPICLTKKSYLNVSELLKNSYTDHGSISGYIDVLSARGKLHATLHEDLWDKAIRCNLKNSSLAIQLKENFNKRVEVYGLIKYNKWGNPQSVEVEEIVPFPDEKSLPTPDEVKGILKGYC